LALTVTGDVEVFHASNFCRVQSCWSSSRSDSRLTPYFFRDVIALAPLVGHDIAYVLQRLHPRHFVLFVSAAIACDSERRMLDLRRRPIDYFCTQQLSWSAIVDGASCSQFLRRVKRAPLIGRYITCIMQKLHNNISFPYLRNREGAIGLRR